jgi:hypothetical protein
MVAYKAVSTFMLLGALCCGQTMPDGILPETPQASMLVRPEKPLPEVPQRKRDRVWNKKFVSAHAAYLGAIIYDVEVTHQGLAHHKCLEGSGSDPTPSRGELYGKTLATFAATVGLDWFLARHKIPIVPYVLPIAGTVVHVRGGTQWFSEGCY